MQKKNLNNKKNKFLLSLPKLRTKQGNREIVIFKFFSISFHRYRRKPNRWQHTKKSDQSTNQTNLTRVQAGNN